MYPKNKDEIRELAKTLTPHQRGRMLVAALRGEMPRNFEWDFDQLYERTDCGSVGCAVGLAVHLGFIRDGDWLDRPIGLSPEAADIFSCCPGALNRYYGGRPAYQVTPLMVADALEQALDDAGAPR